MPATIQSSFSSADIIAEKVSEAVIEYGSQVLVRDTQEALLFYEGRLRSKLTAGTYTLDTGLLPGMNNLLPGGRDSINCEIWYLNKIVKTNYNWGTKSPVSVIDSQYGVIVPVGSYGSIEAYIGDFEAFFRQAIGARKFFSSLDLEKLLEPVIQREVKTLIAQECQQSNIYTLTLEIKRLSDLCKDCIEGKLNQFGVSIRDFYINNLSVVGNDPSLIEIKNSLAKAASVRIESKVIEESRDSYVTKRGFDVLEKAADASSELSAGLASAGIGIGAGAAMANMIGQIHSNNNPDLNSTTQKTVAQRLKELNMLLEEGAINENDYNETKQRILSSL